MIIDGFLFTIGVVLALYVILLVAAIAGVRGKPPTMAEILRERRTGSRYE